MKFSFSFLTLIFIIIYNYSAFSQIIISTNGVNNVERNNGFNFFPFFMNNNSQNSVITKIRHTENEDIIEKEGPNFKIVEVRHNMNPIQNKKNLSPSNYFHPAPTRVIHRLDNAMENFFEGLLEGLIKEDIKNSHNMNNLDNRIRIIPFNKLKEKRVFYHNNSNDEKEGMDIGSKFDNELDTFFKENKSKNKIKYSNSDLNTMMIQKLESNKETNDKNKEKSLDLELELNDNAKTNINHLKENESLKSTINKDSLSSKKDDLNSSKDGKNKIINDITNKIIKTSSKEAAKITDGHKIESKNELIHNKSPNSNTDKTNNIEDVNEIKKSSYFPFTYKYDTGLNKKKTIQILKYITWTLLILLSGYICYWIISLVFNRDTKSSETKEEQYINDNISNNNNIDAEFKSINKTNRSKYY